MAQRRLRDNTRLGPLQKPTEETSLRYRRLWEMKKLLELRIGGEWEPFQEKVGVYGMRRRINLFKDLAFYVGISVRTSIYRFDLIRPSGQNPRLDEESDQRNPLYQVFVYVSARGFGYQETRPKIMFTTATMDEAVRKLTRYLTKMRRIISRV